MPKKKRVWYPGAVYHIMCRGNRRGDIYRDEEDYQVYFSILKQVQEKYEFMLYSYCLMTNHMHLQMQTKNIELCKIMRSINLLYTKYFNIKYNLVGHLFQGRYVGELIETDSYNLQTSRYIHLNPLKAKMVEKVIDYKWSSYNIYVENKKSILVNEDEILKYFKDFSRTQYQIYVENKATDDDIVKSWDDLED